MSYKLELVTDMEQNRGTSSVFGSDGTYSLRGSERASFRASLRVTMEAQGSGFQVGPLPWRQSVVWQHLSGEWGNLIPFPYVHGKFLYRRPFIGWEIKYSRS